jgi:hypothetical protein
MGNGNVPAVRQGKQNAVRQYLWSAVDSSLPALRYRRLSRRLPFIIQKFYWNPIVTMVASKDPYWSKEVLSYTRVSKEELRMLGLEFVRSVAQRSLLSSRNSANCLLQFKKWLPFHVDNGRCQEIPSVLDEHVSALSPHSKFNGLDACLLL